ATRRSFQIHRNWKMISDARAGTESGSTILKKTVRVPAPSISADSNRSAGSARKEFASRYTAKGRPYPVWASQTPVMAQLPRAVHQPLELMAVKGRNELTKRPSAGTIQARVRPTTTTCITTPCSRSASQAGVKGAACEIRAGAAASALIGVTPLLGTAGG